MSPSDFEPWLKRWDLQPDGAPIAGTFASLLPVLRGEEPAMLKIGLTPGEDRGLDLLAWWDGDGVVRILERAKGAVLMQRTVGARSLAAMAHAGEDEAALAVLCDAAARLHRPRAAMPPMTLSPLSERFQPLEAASGEHGGVVARGWVEARALLATMPDERPLHGDLWHDNVRDDAGRRWLVIDPKGFVGDRCYDHAIMVSTPGFPAIAAEPERLLRRARFVAGYARLDLQRLLRCVLVDAGLYALWSMSEGHPPTALAVAEIAAQALDDGGGD